MKEETVLGDHDEYGPQGCSRKDKTIAELRAEVERHKANENELNERQRQEWARAETAEAEVERLKRLMGNMPTALMKAESEVERWKGRAELMRERVIRAEADIELWVGRHAALVDDVTAQGVRADKAEAEMRKLREGLKEDETDSFFDGFDDVGDSGTS